MQRSAVVLQMASGHQKCQDDFPNEVKVQMKQFQELLGQLRTALKPLTENRAAVAEEADGRVKQPLTSARSDLTTCYAVNSLFWGESCARRSAPLSQTDSRAAYLIASGQNPKEHDVKRELNRLKVSMSRLRELSDRGAARPMRLDVPAASRMAKHGLCQPEPDQEDEAESGRKRKKQKT